MRTPSFLSRLLVFLGGMLAHSAALAAGTPSQDTMLVPGGVEAAVRIEPRLSHDPLLFGRELVPELLKITTVNHDPRAHPARLALLELAALKRTVDRLAGAGGRISRKGGADETEEFCAALGYECFAKRRKLTFARGTGVEATVRRRVARALDLGPPRTLERLAEGETIRVSIGAQELPSPYPHELIAHACGKDVNAENAFEILAGDQRAGLVLDAWAQLDPETRATLDGDLLGRIARHAPHMFHRTGSSLVVREGRLRVPGGPAAEELWNELLGLRAGKAQESVAMLYDSESSPGLVLWFAMSGQTPARVDAWLRHIATSGGLEAWEEILERTERGTLTRAFPAYVQRLDPGRVPQAALTGAHAGRARAQALELAGCRGAECREDAVAFLGRLEIESPDALGLVKELELTGEQILALERAMGTVEEVSDSMAREAHALVLETCGEIARVLVRNRALSHEQARDFVGEVLASHDGRSIDSIRVQRALAELLGALPEAGPAAPGRMPLEARLLAAMIPPDVDAPFHRSGLRYAGARSRESSGTWLRRFEDLRVPPIDSVIDPESSPGASGEDGARRMSREEREDRKERRALLARMVDTPEPDPEASAGVYCRPEFLRRALDSNKAVILNLERALVPYAYMDALADIDSPFLETMRYHARHSAYRQSNPARRSGRSVDHLWSEARFVSAAESSCGARIAGHLGGLRKALIAPLRLDAGAGFDNTERLGSALGAWFEEARVSRWAGWSAEELEALARLVELGERAWAARRANAPIAEAIDGFLPFVVAEGGMPLGWGDRLELGRACALDDSCSESMGFEGSGERLVELSRTFVGRISHYQAFALEAGERGLIEREGQDIRIAVASHLGAQGLPGHVGARLHEAVVRAAGAELQLGELGDWESFVQWSTSLDDEFFEEAFIQCLLDGKFSLVP